MIPQYVPMIPTQVPEPFHRDGWVYEEKVDGPRILALARLAKVPNHVLVEDGFLPILIGPGFVECCQCSGELVRGNCCASDEEHEHLRELSVESPHLRLQALRPVNETSQGLLLTNIQWHSRSPLTAPPTWAL
jgi:hypothetical protein